MRFAQERPAAVGSDQVLDERSSRTTRRRFRPTASGTGKPLYGDRASSCRFAYPIGHSAVLGDSRSQSGFLHHHCVTRNVLPRHLIQPLAAAAPTSAQSAVAWRLHGFKLEATCLIDDQRIERLHKAAANAVVGSKPHSLSLDEIHTPRLQKRYTVLALVKTDAPAAVQPLAKCLEQSLVYTIKLNVKCLQSNERLIGAGAWCLIVKRVERGW